MHDTLFLAGLAALAIAALAYLLWFFRQMRHQLGANDE